MCDLEHGQAEYVNHGVLCQFFLCLVSGLLCFLSCVVCLSSLVCRLSSLVVVFWVFVPSCCVLVIALMHIYSLVPCFDSSVQCRALAIRN